MKYKVTIAALWVPQDNLNINSITARYMCIALVILHIFSFSFLKNTVNYYYSLFMAKKTKG